MIHLRADGIGYLLVFLAEYQELHTLSAGIHHIVKHQVLDENGAETEYYFSYGIDGFIARLVAEYEEGTAHDEEIHKDEHPAQRDVVILVYHCGDDVGAARTAIVQEYDG